MPFKVNIKVAGGKAGFSRKVATIVRNLSDRQLRAIAEKSAETMRGKIKDSTTRADSSGNLASAIFSEQVAPGHYGVGRIDYLNSVAPYWNHVDKGSVAVGASHNHRVPVGGFIPGFVQPVRTGSGQRWFVAQGGWSFVPQKPIKPMDYIAKTLVEQNSIISQVLRTVR